jgi:hypothetical protein
VFPVGLFDLNREPRSVAQAYKHLVEMYHGKIELTETEAALLEIS